MQDKRFTNISIFNRRSDEWNLEVIKKKIVEIFKNINSLEYYKFSKAEWSVSGTKRKEELKKHIYKTLKIYVDEYTKKNTVKKTHVYNIQIPVLINNQFFYMGGLLKTPIFQLYDHPVIYRNTRTGKILKFKNNNCTITTNTNKNNDVLLNIYIGNMKLHKNIPMDLLICCKHNQDEYDNFISSLPKLNNIINKLTLNCHDLWSKYNKKQLLEELGKYRVSAQNVDSVKKGESIIFSLDLSYTIDIFTKEFMETECVLFELIHTLSTGVKEDNNIDNKRIRFSEYILSDFIKTVYDMICTLNFSKRLKFKLTPSIILDSCNVNSIIHHNFNYNPLGELAALMQCTLIGPGSFKKENVPLYMKTIHNSQYGRICPADTPDRDGCGVVLNMVPGVNVESNGKFSKKVSDIVCSFPISLVPFTEHNDQTRLQMASGQMKQSILLENAEKPLIKTGAESNYLEHTTFKNLAKYNGRVVYKDNTTLIVRYNRNKKLDIFNIGYRPMYLNSIDYIGTNLKVGDRFKKDDILCQSKFIKDDELALGNNLLTSINVWEGYNYEDGIVVNESIVDKYKSIHYLDLSFNIEGGQILLSLEDDNYKPLPTIGDKLKRGDVYAKIKHMHDENFESINIEPKELIVDRDCEIIDIEIYANSWNKQIVPFNNFVLQQIVKQKEKYDNIIECLEDGFTSIEINDILLKNNLTKLNYNFESTGKGKYVEKGNLINGLRINIKAIYKSSLEVGDKMANRYGGKGVVSTIVPNENMPTLPDGRKVEIIINPLGIISRMNVGQLYELHLNEALYLFKNKLKDIINNNKNCVRILINELKTLCSMIDNTEDKWVTKNIIDTFKCNYKIDKLQAVDKLQIIQPAFKSINPKQLDEIMKYTGAKYKYELFNDKTKTKFNNEIACGYVYFDKLIHRSSEKMSARSIGPYMKNTLQPVSGKSNKGGLRLGEMETWSLLSCGADITIKELLTTYSDSAKEKNKLLLNILNNGLPNNNIETDDDESQKPRTVQLLDAYIKILGMNLEL